MATPNNFPSRVKFTDPYGMLTPEAVRALNSLVSAVVDAGSLTIDTSQDVSASATGSQFDGGVMHQEVFAQPIDSFPALLPDIFFPSDSSAQMMLQEVFAPATEAAAIISVTAGASPYTWVSQQSGTLSIQGGVVSVVALARQGVSVTLGLTAGLVPVASGDSITITYSVVPTLKFIPR